MKRFMLMMAIFMMISGFSFVAGGNPIQQYEHPKTALLVLDMQEDFLDEKGKAPINKEQIPGVTAVVNSLIDEFEKSGQLIIYVKSEFPRFALGNRIRRHAAMEGSLGANIYSKIRVSGTAVFSKKNTDAFSNKEFEKYLVDHQVNRLVVTGVYADQCVLETTLEALKRNYQVKFVRNGVGDRSEKEVNKACEKVQEKGAEIIDYIPNTRIK
jgi:nicotinamidase/pyrazinamidase